MFCSLYGIVLTYLERVSLFAPPGICTCTYAVVAHRVSVMSNVHILHNDQTAHPAASVHFS